MKPGWKTVRLGEVCAMIKRGIAPAYIDQGGICVLNQKCVRNHSVNYDLSRRHDIDLKKVPKERFVEKGDVLVNSTGTGTLGRVAQIRSEPKEYTTVDTHITILRPKKNILFEDFFGYMVISIESLLQESGAGTSGQTELSRTTVQNDFLVCYPESLPEQRAIVEKLDALRDKTRALEGVYTQKLDALAALRHSVLHHAFRGEL